MEQTAEKAKEPETIHDMFVAIQQEAIGRMKASQENIEEIKRKQHEALDKGDSENFEIHKLSYESNLRTLDSHRKLVLEITDKLDPNSKQDERGLPRISSIGPQNPLDIEVVLMATTEDMNPVKLKIKCDLHGLIKQRPFYGFEDTEPKVPDGPDHDLLQAACGFILRGYVHKVPATELAKDTFDNFKGQTVDTAQVEDEAPVIFSKAKKAGDKIQVVFGEDKDTVHTVEIPVDATLVVTKDGKHVWYSHDKVDGDKNSSFNHLMSLSG